MPPWGCPGGAGEGVEAYGWPEPSPCLPGLPWQAGAEDGQPRSCPTLDVPSGSGPEVRWGRPPLPCLGLSPLRFERIEGTEEGTG